jgi:hypothetical protein
MNVIRVSKGKSMFISKVSSRRVTPTVEYMKIHRKISVLPEADF